MATTLHAPAERIGGRDTPPVESALISIEQLAKLLNCSTRHAHRLRDAGKLPAPVKLGALIRWRLSTGDPTTGICDWIAAGCPAVRTVKGGPRL